MLLAYAGPETVLPLSSALAIVAGIAMGFWPALVKFIRMGIAGGTRLFRPAKASRIGADQPPKTALSSDADS
jgi:hypothetical protein